MRKNGPKFHKFENYKKAKIKVIGIGGGGGSIVSEIASKLDGIQTIAANTDLQALNSLSKKCKKFHFGADFTAGLGTGMNFEVGRLSAEKEKAKIEKLLKGADLCILVSCLGGGTGSGAVSVFAETSKKLKNLTLGIFTLPFKFEGKEKSVIAKKALELTRPMLDGFAVIPNERIFKIINPKTPIKRAFSFINKTLAEDLKGLIEMVYSPGLINIDFADLKAILKGRGDLVYLNTAKAQGKKRSEEIIKNILSSPFLNYDIKGARGILYNICSDSSLKMSEVEEISRVVSNYNPRAKIIFGVSQHKKYKNRIEMTLLATGCGGKQEKRKRKVKQTKKRSGNLKEKEKTSKSTGRKKEIKSEKKDDKFMKEKKRGKMRVDRYKKSKRKTEGKRKKAEINIKRKNIIGRDDKRVEEPKKEEKIQLRRNALEIKKTLEEAEKQMLEQEKKWEIPAFLRRKK